MCEQLDYDLRFRWFLDLDLESGGLDQSNVSSLREHLVETDIARRFFDELVRLARKDKLLSSDHFTVDGTFCYRSGYQEVVGCAMDIGQCILLCHDRKRRCLSLYVSGEDVKRMTVAGWDSRCQ